VRGAGAGAPDPALPWTVFAGTGEGVTTGFTGRDRAGWFAKFARRSGAKTA
jgi:hypothetical protein